MTPGQAAFEKWLELTPHAAVYMTWGSIPGESREAWEEIAKAAVKAHYKPAASTLRAWRDEDELTSETP